MNVINKMLQCGGRGRTIGSGGGHLTQRRRPRANHLVRSPSNIGLNSVPCLSLHKVQSGRRSLRARIPHTPVLIPKPRSMPTPGLKPLPSPDRKTPPIDLSRRRRLTRPNRSAGSAPLLLALVTMRHLFLSREAGTAAGRRRVIMALKMSARETG